MAREGGLIDGEDFLSLYINQDNVSNDRSFLREAQRSGRSRTTQEITTNSNDSITKSIKIPSAQTERNELAEENTFPPANRVKHNDYESYSESATDLNHFNFIAKAENIPNDSQTKDSDETDVSIGYNVVKLVTSGSKIVFLEEAIVRDSNSTESKYSVQNDTANNLFKDDEERPDEIKVISVRITSSQSQNADPIVYRSDTGSNEKENILISNVGKSDFSIEEVEPFTSESVKDSSKEESVHIESIIDPPTAAALEPIQTIIIHDHNYRKEGSARPRSVSYSSISQSVNQKIWKGNQKHSREHQLYNRTQHVSEPSAARLYSEPEQVYSEPAKIYSEASKVYGEPSKYYSEPAKVYSEPSKVYGEQEKIYSEPSKVYSEPARIYSEPSKVYSKPSKVYGEPSKVYGQPSKVYSLPAGTVYPTTTTTQAPSTQRPTKISTTTQPPQLKKVIFNLDKLPYDLLNAPAAEENKNYLFAPQLDNQRFHQFTRKSQEQQFETPLIQSQHQHHEHIGSEHLLQSTVDTTTPQHSSTPDQNYEIDEAVSVMTNGQQHGVQPPTNSPSNEAADPDPKVGFVVEGRNFRKYRVEEKTPDGFIVGEYGVVSNNDGSLRGVRYTADSNISPNLIYEALMKFLSL